MPKVRKNTALISENPEPGFDMTECEFISDTSISKSW